MKEQRGAQSGQRQVEQEPVPAIELTSALTRAHPSVPAPSAPTRPASWLQPAAPVGPAALAQPTQAVVQVTNVNVTTNGPVRRWCSRNRILRQVSSSVRSGTCSSAGGRRPLPSSLLRGPLHLHRYPACILPVQPTADYPDPSAAYPTLHGTDGGRHHVRGVG
jgi:hypothetical protein